MVSNSKCLVCIILHLITVHIILITNKTGDDTNSSPVPLKKSLSEIIFKNVLEFT
jgi:hypothetical protein